jgi:dTDP-4-dehydrorhamnose 3,5-epimerase
MPFTRLESRLEGPILVAPDVYGDDRGFLLESYRDSDLAALGVPDEFVQENHSRSAQGVIRGIHFKVGAGMAKLIRCARGRILDVVVDVRVGSPTFGQWEGFELDDVSHHMIYVPIGFGHGFCVLSEQADVLYRCSSYYEPEFERGIAYDDPDVGIDWPVQESSVSERDATAPRLADVQADLPFRYA